MRVLELFSGLGGWRYALGGLGEVVAAYDISPVANAAYLLNHGERPLDREIARLKPEQLAAHGAEAWVLSPPCQPFCRMGQHRDLEDRRCQALRHLMALLPELAPRWLALENVEGFLGSEAHALVLGSLRRAGLEVLEYRLCPSRFGLPNQRPRVFLLAARRPMKPAPPPDLPAPPLADFLDAEEDPSLYLSAEQLARHRQGLDLVRAGDRRSACFIGGYGQRYVGSGSFLVTGRGIRRFSPAEVARLLGLPESFRFPPELSLEQRYKLLGNGLSQPVAAWVLAQLLG